VKDEGELCGGVTIYKFSPLVVLQSFYVVAGSLTNCDFFRTLPIGVVIFHLHVYISIIQTLTDSWTIDAVFIKSNITTDSALLFFDNCSVRHGLMKESCRKKYL
jgi:hypothetical protein